MTDGSGSSLLQEIKDAELVEDNNNLFLPAKSSRPCWYEEDSRLSGSRVFCFMAAQIALFTISATLLVASLATRPVIPTSSVEKLSAISSALGIVDEDYRTVRFRGSFHLPSLYKGPPSPAVDDAWDMITRLGAMRISEGAFSKLNASVHSVKIPEDHGGGRLALFEFIHQMHCVQMLWQVSYPDYYQELRNFSFAQPERYHEHIDHCADLLLQKLKCDADVGIVTYNWVKHHRAPYPNFNVQHQCRDFDVLLEYAIDHQVNASSLKDGYFTRPAEAVVDFAEPPFDPQAEV